MREFTLYVTSCLALHLLTFPAGVERAAQATSADDKDTATITGTVRAGPVSAALPPLSGATISVYKITGDRGVALTPERYRADKVLSAVSDPNGNYTIPRLRSGEYLVTCEAPGWLRSEYWGLMLLPGTTHVTDFWLVPPQGDGIFPPITWDGIVRSSAGELVAGATVIAVDLRDHRLATQCRTDSVGRYEMTLPRAGSYIVYASKPGYTPNPIVGRTGAEKKLDLVLSPSEVGPSVR